MIVKEGMVARSGSQSSKPTQENYEALSIYALPRYFNLGSAALPQIVAVHA